MRVLSIDTSSELGTAAVVVDGIVAASIASRVNSQHGETLLPLLDHLLKLAHLAIEDIDLLAVGLGPGSFTGVRIGVATAKGLSLARGTKMVGVTTSRVLARAASGEVRAVVIDAKKDEVFVSAYRATAMGLTLLSADVHGSPRDVAAQLAALSANEGKLTLLGSALVVHGDVFRAALPDATLLPQVFSAPRGEVLALEAMEAFALRGADDPSSLVPIYVRGADAKLPGGISLQMTEHLATLWLGETHAVACAFNKTTEGQYVMSMAMAAGARSEAARAVREALASAQTGVEPVTSEELKAANQALLVAAKVKTRKALQKSFKHVLLSLKSDALSVVPTRLGTSGDDRGYHELTPIVLAWPSDTDALTDALDEAAQRCC